MNCVLSLELLQEGGFLEPSEDLDLIMVTLDSLGEVKYLLLDRRGRFGLAPRGH